MAGSPLGGAESFYARAVCAIAKYDDIEQYAFTRADDYRLPQMEAAGVPVSTFRFGGPLDFVDNYRYKKALKEVDPDIVLTYMNRPSGKTPSGKYTLVCRLGHYYNLKYYRNADLYIGITWDICDYLIRNGVPAKKIVRIPNFVDETEAEPIARDSFGTDPDKPLLLSIGRLHHNKAFDTLLHAMTKVPEATLWLAGEGPERANLEALCNELNLNDRVKFLGWRRDINSLMRAVDLFVCPSRHEGLGSIVLESWFNSCPIVSTASQGPAELIEHGITGLVTPIDYPDALADAINSLLADPEKAKVMSENAHKHYHENFSEEKISSQYVELFHAIVEKRFPE